ncbi:hypothetical protein ACFW2T_14360, partial [Streptomyces sp. NPDC058892]|uniref:hypothetical protein n=1 Tax=Streptomyces sp. NPDC058892 TaxID=3346668 RepID=UPI0036D0C166
MTTTARGRIPRLICASCISSALLISAGATTAIAAAQSPPDATVQSTPQGDSSGTDTSGTDTSGTDTSGTDTSGTDTSGTDTSGTDTSGT